jgi:hypothetical protein
MLRRILRSEVMPLIAERHVEEARALLADVRR